MTVQDYNIDVTDILKKLMANATVELKRSLKRYKEEDAHNRLIINEFEISDQFMSQTTNTFSNALDFDSIMIAEFGKLEKIYTGLFISTFESYAHSLSNALLSFEEYNSSVVRQLKRYELAYVEESQRPNEDLLDLTSIQTSVLKLQDEIHEANEQQEQKKSVINKLSLCFQIHEKIKKCMEKKEKIAESLKNLRNLPPNLSDAESKLRELKQKFKEVCDTFTKEVTT